MISSLIAIVVLTGINPDFHISINQYLTGDMQEMYNISPSVGGGISIPLSSNRAFRITADFIYDRGEVSDYSPDAGFRGNSDLTAVMLETSWEFSAPFFERKNFYYGIGPVLGVGSERIPASDTSATITTRTNWGTGLGAVVFLGARLVSFSKWSVGVKSGIRFLALPVRNEWGRYPIDLSGLALALTIGR